MSISRRSFLRGVPKVAIAAGAFVAGVKIPEAIEIKISKKATPGRHKIIRTGIPSPTWRKLYQDVLPTKNPKL